ncbi:MAG: hypothetical protein WD426_03325 [Anditalea sp.]
MDKPINDKGPEQENQMIIPVLNKNSSCRVHYPMHIVRYFLQSSQVVTLLIADS